MIPPGISGGIPGRIGGIFTNPRWDGFLDPTQDFRWDPRWDWWDPSWDPRWDASRDVP